ncbi:MAG: hypothetical protein ACYTFW_23925 [Planctomycetota bacterium]|jgi:hypothetical protein
MKLTLSDLSKFLVDIEDLANERGILAHIGIPSKLHEDADIWVCICNFQVGRDISPPDLGVKVSDGLGVEDEVR